MATLTKDVIINAIADMSVMEVSELVKAMEDKFGVSASAAPAVAAPAAGAAGALNKDEGDSDEEKLVSVVLEGSDASKKIPTIKEVRAITGLGLKDAKDLVETAGAVVKDSVPIGDAKKIKEQLESVGATVVLK